MNPERPAAVFQCAVVFEFCVFLWLWSCFPKPTSWVHWRLRMLPQLRLCCFSMLGCDGLAKRLGWFLPSPLIGWVAAGIPVTPNGNTAGWFGGWTVCLLICALWRLVRGLNGAPHYSAAIKAIRTPRAADQLSVDTLSPSGEVWFVLALLPFSNILHSHPGATPEPTPPPPPEQQVLQKSPWWSMLWYINVSTCEQDR